MKGINGWHLRQFYVYLINQNRQFFMDIPTITFKGEVLLLKIQGASTKEGNYLLGESLIITVVMVITRVMATQVILDRAMAILDTQVMVILVIRYHKIR